LLTVTFELQGSTAYSAAVRADAVLSDSVTASLTVTSCNAVSFDTTDVSDDVDAAIKQQSGCMADSSFSYLQILNTDHTCLCGFIVGKPQYAPSWLTTDQLWFDC